jgi:ADP-ribose pyrophosphatase YjhB (NUDIX family)
MIFKYCPLCGSTRIAFIDHRYWVCDECDFVYYHNVAAAAGVLIPRDGGYLFLERAREPGKGLLDIPGGFLEPDESAEAAAVRETGEETGLTVSGLRFLESRPNDYRYKKIPYKVCDIFFEAASAEGTLTPAAEEVKTFRILKPEELRREMIAFPSVWAMLKNRFGLTDIG